MEGYYAMGASMSGDACNQSWIYSGTAKSVKPLSSQGYSKGDDKYWACTQYVDLPAHWSYAITMKARKPNTNKSK